MKKLLCVVLVVVMMLSLVACGKTLKGAYEAEVDLFVAKYTATYEFSGSKVEITKKTNVFGSVNTAVFEGKYEIAENDDGSMEITITLESGDDEIKSGTYTFEEGENYIKIAGIQYDKK